MHCEGGGEVMVVWGDGEGEERGRRGGGCGGRRREELGGGWWGRMMLKVRQNINKRFEGGVGTRLKSPVIVFLFLLTACGGGERCLVFTTNSSVGKSLLNVQ